MSFKVYINNRLYDELGCDPKIRRQCDSGYIKMYRDLLKKYEKLSDEYNKLKEENESLKQLAEVYQVFMKGGE